MDYAWYIKLFHRFQSTLPRGERPSYPQFLLFLIGISIHAPARGATSSSSSRSFEFVISIHAPARGATLLSSISAVSHRYFNPRSREGSDVQQLLPVLRVCNFNPRSREGSDVNLNNTIARSVNFNPRSREGSDDPDDYEMGPGTIFQSTLPRGERLYNAIIR